MNKYHVSKYKKQHGQNSKNYQGNGQKNYPAHRSQQRTHHQSPQKMFNGNIVNNMKFGGKDHDLSGYVERTVYMKDRHGNVQVAKERQFFNSSKNGLNVRIGDEKKRHD